MASRKGINVGEEFARLTVIGPDPDRKGGYWLCLCSCPESTVKSIRGDGLKSGAVKSCGCWSREATKHRPNPNKTHGMATTPEYSSWRAMLERCLNPDYKFYPNYGGRGIEVCDQWQGDDGFQQFFSDMGSRPSDTHSLDRIDNEGDYQPTNCRWATKKQQQNNRRNTVYIAAYGVRLTLSDWSAVMGIPHSTLGSRRQEGFTDIAVVYTPYPGHNHTKRATGPVLYGEFYM